MKWPLFAAVGACGDLQCRRRVPFVALTALGAAAVAGLVVSLIKGISDRARPPIADPALHAIGVVPDSTSFPSGHSATGFATAIVVGAAYPRLRLPLLGLAALVALSRVYLGMHYWSDVLAGSLLGVAIGLGLLFGQTWARVAGIAVAVLVALANFAWLPHFPLWSLLIIAFNVVVIWALTTQMQEGDAA